jgi:hypothetical protein
VITLSRPGAVGSVRLFCVTVKVWPPTVIVPERAAPGFATTANDTDPDPLPELVVVIHAAFDVADHAQPVVVLTLNDPVSTEPLTVRLLGERLKVQLPPAACVIVKLWPAIVIEPKRVEAVAFPCTLKPTVPLPVPLAPDVTVMNGALLDDVHAHPVVVVTVTEPGPPAPGIDCVPGEIENEQEPADWFTVNVLPATVSVPERLCVAVFAAPLKFTVPLPFPLAPLVIVSHAALLVAVQLQPVWAVTADEPVPPAAASCWLVGLIA